MRRKNKSYLPTFISDTRNTKSILQKTNRSNCDKPNSLITNDSCSLTIEYWFDSQEAADYLRISKKSLLNMVSNGKMPFYKLGRRNRYRLSDLQKILLAEPRGGFDD